MRKFILPIVISMVWIFYRTNQYFEGNINTNSQVKSFETQKRFFLPYPKNYELINEYEELNQEIKIIKSNSEISYLNGFYQEILRSKSFDKDYEYETDLTQEFKYSKNKEEIIIILNKETNGTSIMFKHLD